METSIDMLERCRSAHAAYTDKLARREWPLGLTDADRRRHLGEFVCGFLFDRCLSRAKAGMPSISLTDTVKSYFSVIGVWADHVDFTTANPDDFIAIGVLHASEACAAYGFTVNEQDGETYVSGWASQPGPVERKQQWTSI